MLSVAKAAGRIVVKVGSSLVTNDGRGLDGAAIAHWAGQIAAIRGTEVWLKVTPTMTSPDGKIVVGAASASPLKSPRPARPHHYISMYVLCIS